MLFGDGSYEHMLKDGTPWGEGKSRDPQGNLFAGEFEKLSFSC